jgi:hypothetical protein
MDDFHQLLARIALDAAAEHGFALAGGYAVQAHGILQRPSEDIDLFTSTMRDDFTNGTTNPEGLTGPRVRRARRHRQPPVHAPVGGRSHHQAGQ